MYLSLERQREREHIKGKKKKNKKGQYRCNWSVRGENWWGKKIFETVLTDNINENHQPSFWSTHMHVHTQSQLK